MSTRYNNGSHYENHQRAAELHDLAAHAHRAAESHGQTDHLTSHERSRQASELSGAAHYHTQTVLAAHGMAPFGHKEIEDLAQELWRSRGCPKGSPQEDWFHAVEQLRTRYLAP